MRTRRLDARLEIGYFDVRDARDGVRAEVELVDGRMTLVVHDQGAAVLYHGERRGQGHYLLRAQGSDAEATLHRFADSTILEGFWRSGRDRGFWRLHLPADAPLELRVRPKKPAASAQSRPRGARKRIRIAA